MNISTAPQRLAARLAASALAVSAALCSASAYAAVNSGSTGADGPFNPTVNTEVVLPPSGVLNYTTVNIPAGVTVTFKKNAANTPVYLLATGDVTVAGIVDIRGGAATATGTAGDGVLGDDGVPGVGGPGGYGGGRGGRDDQQNRAEIQRGGQGLGPGGGTAGLDRGVGCTVGSTGNEHYFAGGAGHAFPAYQLSANACGLANITSFGKSYGSPLLQPLLGGSGGGGGLGGANYGGGGGGGGGGAILIAASGTVRITGTINADGGVGGTSAGAGGGLGGGGGSGGAIRLVGTLVTGNGTLVARGGSGGSSGGGAGSVGRIRIEGEAITFVGGAAPVYIADLPGPIFIDGAPSLRIAAVAGQAVPAEPTGNADVLLPATTTGPISVTFETVNVPVGNTVLLRIAPAYGPVIEALSPAIAGTSAAGTAAVNVTLPSGPSTLQATTTYTVVVAGGPDLSHFAQNEAVEKVEVTVALAGEARARLITVSGKQFDVPYQALRAAGFRG